MALKADLKKTKTGFRIVLDCGIYVSMHRNEYGYEPARYYSNAKDKALFARCSAGITYNEIIEAFIPLVEELKKLEVYASDLYTIADVIMFARARVRGRAVEFMSEAHMARIDAMMGEAPKKEKGSNFNIEGVIRGL